MNKNKKFKKKELEEIIDNITPVIYIGYEFEIKEELFAQIKVDNYYIPYIISSYGRIFSVFYNGSNYFNIKQLKTNINKYGYERINLFYNGSFHYFQIHDLVAQYFVYNDDIKNKNQVNHIDCIKTHNFSSNLEWCTAKENVHHAEINKLRNHPHGINHAMNVNSEDDIIKVCKLLSLNQNTIKEISEITGISSKLIYQIYKKKTWKSISKYYNIDNFDKINIKSDKYKEERSLQINNVCKLIESNLYTLSEISIITGVNYKIISKILNHKIYTSISEKYDFSNFNNYKINKKGSTTIESII